LLDMLANLPREQAAGVRAAIAAGDNEAIYAALIGIFGVADLTVCVVEDAHWADGATLDLLRYLARRIGALPVLVVVSYRDDEIGPQHPLAVLLGDLATSAVVKRIQLDPLSSAAVGQLAAGSGINGDALYRITDGNPFFVTEVLAAGPGALAEQGMPHSVSEVVAGRLARLSAAGRQTAHATAVCGPRASASLVEAVCPGATLTECLDAGVLIADADTVGFRHELARRATVDQLPTYQRRLLHKRALTVLAQPPIDPNTLAALTFHADQAGDADAVIHYGPAAAERASGLRANREAAELYELVLSHADAVADEHRVRWLEQHAFSSYLSGLTETSARSFREAIALRHKLGDRLGEGDNLRWLSNMLWPLGRTTEAIQTGVASLGLLEDLGPTPQLAWSLLNMTRLSTFAYDPAAAEYAARAIALGAQLGEDAVVLRARGYAALHNISRSDTGWDDLEAVWRETMTTKEQAEQAGIVGTMLCWFAALHHNVERAEGYIAATSAVCATHDLDVFLPIAAGAAAMVALHRGDWTSALVCADDVLTRPALTPLHRIMALIAAALIHARRGEQPVAELLDEAVASVDDLFRRGAVWAARAESACLVGDDDTARAEANAGLAAATAETDPWLVGHLQRWAHLAGGPAPPVAGDQVTPYHLEIRGDWQSAAAEWSRRRCPYDAAIAQLGGDVDAVAAALNTFRRLGARAAARRAQQRLAQLRGRDPDLRRKDTSADPHGLTKRQRDVLELLAAGHSDTEIAAALYISPKTVNTHVCAIMTKLGVHNRTQAAAYAHQQRSHRGGNRVS
jgi:DNA-binding CsgD family transcriptional regulator